MTRKTRPEFNKKILLDNLKMLNKDIVIKLIAETFSKKDLLDALDYIYSKANFTTNDNIEKHFYRKIAKLDTVENTL